MLPVQAASNKLVMVAAAQVDVGRARAIKRCMKSSVVAAASLVTAFPAHVARFAQEVAQDGMCQSLNVPDLLCPDWAVLVGV
jgi:hypothetical protein